MNVILQREDIYGKYRIRMKQIIRLTESDIHNIVRQVIKEIGYRGAALTHGANYNAQQDYMNSRNPNARTKMGGSENLTMKALSLAIHDNFPNLTLEFVEHNEKTNQSYPVDLRFTDVKYIDNERIVLHGQLTVSLRPFGIGTIEYNFNTQDFYRVSYSDKTTRSRKLHTLLPHNEEQIKRVLTFVSNYLYAREDYETNINTNGSTPSKPH